MLGFTNARIYALDGTGEVYRSLWIEGERIGGVSPSLLSGLRDLEGRTVIPGFIDSHVHLLETGLQLIFPDLSGAESLEDVYERLLKGYPIGREAGFLWAIGFDPDSVKEQRFPDRWELDRVVRHLPLVLVRQDGHSSVLNTRALQEIFTELSPDMEFNPSDEPTGRVWGKAHELSMRHLKRRLPVPVMSEAFRRACELALSRGVTTLVAMVGSEEPDDRSCEVLCDLKDRLVVGVVPFYQTTDLKRVLRLGLERIGGCILVDGSFGSRTAALSEPYLDDPENRGTLYFSDEELLKFLESADEGGLQTAVHAIGDRAVEQVINCYERFLKGNPLRHRLEHAELLTLQLIERIGRLGLILSVQPAFEGFWGGEGKMYHRRLGERAFSTNPYRLLLDAGIRLVGGSDSPVTPLDPALGMRWAQSHPNPRFRLSPVEALRLFTTDAAYGIHQEEEVGQLSPGRYADLLVVDPEIRVIEVYRRGRRVYP